MADTGRSASPKPLLAAIPRSPFDEYIGTEWLDLGPEEASARIAVKGHHKQPMGLVHGGVLATLGESICSVATYRAVAGDGMTIVGQSSAITFLRSVTDGCVTAVARPQHRGRTTWVWDVEIRDEAERVCALVRVTVAVRPERRDA